MTLSSVSSFVLQKKLHDTYAFTMCDGGEATLYSSCFAVMILQYIGQLENLSPIEKRDWAAQINSWQDPESGLYLGPEIVKDKLTSPKHDYEHVTMHLAAHVLPTLALLGVQPKYPLTFSHTFLDTVYLLDWLNKRDWKDAWLEGNNLLFIGQFLVFLRDVEAKSGAQKSLDIYFDWLDSQLDPNTGLWGTNSYCSSFVAMCGGYHQLLVYYHERRPVLFKEELIDTVLDLQHEDGGFAPEGGGGACEDVDAVDILVNMYKQIDYRRADIRAALRKCLRQILTLQKPDGGFPYKDGVPFIHMGIPATASPAGVSNMFGTWFRVHTIALIAEILTDEVELEHYDFLFNTVLSMGWHKKWDKAQHQLCSIDRFAESVATKRVAIRQNLNTARRLYWKAKNKVARIYDK